MWKFDIRSYEAQELQERSDLSDFTYSPGGFKEYDNNASGHNRNSNDNDSNINDNNNRNTDNKHKNINKGNIHFRNS